MLDHDQFDKDRKIAERVIQNTLSTLSKEYGVPLDAQITELRTQVDKNDTHVVHSVKITGLL